MILLRLAVREGKKYGDIERYRSRRRQTRGNEKETENEEKKRKEKYGNIEIDGVGTMKKGRITQREGGKRRRT